MTGREGDARGREMDEKKREKKGRERRDKERVRVLLCAYLLLMGIRTLCLSVTRGYGDHP